MSARTCLMFFFSAADESGEGSVDLSRLSLRDGGLLARLERDFERELEESVTDYAPPAQLSSAPPHAVGENDVTALGWG